MQHLDNLYFNFLEFQIISFDSAGFNINNYIDRKQGQFDHRNSAMQKIILIHLKIWKKAKRCVVREGVCE